MFKIFYNFCAGFFMGLAEVTPGISGATIAGIFNVYKDFLSSLSAFNHSVWLKGIKNFIQQLNTFFLLPLLLGMAISIFLAANFIDYLIQNFLFALKVFLSMVMLFAVIKNIFFDHQFLKTKRYIISFLIGIGVAGAISLALINLNFNSFFLLVIAGFFGFSAFILPGISGSLVFLILGVYSTIITAITNLNFLELVPVAAGMLVSFLLLPKKIVEKFEQNSEQTIMIFSGLIFGSIPAVWLHLHA